MASDAPKVVAVGHVGGREQTDSEWHTIRAVFHDFASLPHERGSFTESPTLQCHGYEWQVKLYPGGSDQSDEPTPHVSVFLRCVSANTSTSTVVKAGYKIRVASVGFGKQKSNTKTLFRDSYKGWKGYIPRSDIFDPSRGFLVDGDLTIEVDIQVALDKPPSWTPSNTVCADWLKMFESANVETADVSFQVGADETKEVFYAHSVVLKTRSPTLASFAEDYDSNTPIPIEDIGPDTFKALLRFVYGGEIPAKDFLASNPRTLIHAANKFGITSLKLAAEAELASAGISVENAADLILFADGTNCAMLKEAALDFFVSNSEAVMESDGYAKVEESPAILSELVKAAIGSKKRSAPSGPEDRDYKRMRVASLRQRLDSKGLDVDGSREMLISRLEATETIERD